MIRSRHRSEILASRLVEAGLLPSGQQPPAGLYASDQNLLPLLLAAWRRELRRANCGPTHADLVSWLQEQVEVGAELQLSELSGNRRGGIGPRLAWWPHGVPTFQRTAFVSSRLGRRLDHRNAWFRYLRAACARVDSSKEGLLAVRGTATGAYVSRCADLFNRAVLRVRVADAQLTHRSWLRQLGLDKHHRDPVRSGQHFDLSISPEIFDAGSVSEVPLGSVPYRDRMLVGLADRVLALHVRPQGNIHRLLRRGLQQRIWPSGSVWLAMGESELVSPGVADELMQLGAVAWHLPGRADNGVATITDCERTPGRRTTIRYRSEFKPGYWLTHCVRRRHGPWPGQTEQQHLDDLILQRAARERSELATLKRILLSGRLSASKSAIRGGTAVISFTEVPPSQLEPLRQYRAHRSRWDFQPYGISIDRHWLETAGARAAIYGDDATWLTLPASERPYFQRACSGPSASGQIIDWTVEREWRYAGDLDLRKVPTEKVCVFVPSYAEARTLVGYGPWPVIVVNARVK